jgi:Cysteine-rich CPCC
MAKLKYTCPCCGYKTRTREDSTWDICVVCFWQNDLNPNNDPHKISGANRISLLQAQQNFVKFSACDERSIKQVRQPKKNESKDENWKILENNKVQF